MKKKDLTKLANQIAKAEQTIQTSSDAKEIANAKQQILRVSESVNTFEELVLLDDMIQEILKKS